jgi:hypothetical protein
MSFVDGQNYKKSITFSTRREEQSKEIARRIARRASDAPKKHPNKLLVGNIVVLVKKGSGWSGKKSLPPLTICNY